MEAAEFTIAHSSPFRTGLPEPDWRRLAPPFAIHHYPVLESTNTTAREFIRAGFPSGAVIVADLQTAGRGRQGRTWTSLPGALFSSLILRPHGPSELLPRIGFAVCVAVARAAESLGLSHAWTKWPNDLVAPTDSGRRLKWGGILIESGWDDHGLWAVVGVGLNLAKIPGGSGDVWTSLAELIEKEVAPDTMLDGWLAEFRKAFTAEDGNHQAEFTPDLADDEWWKLVQEEWGARDLLSGSRVVASVGGGQVSGIARGMAPSGALRLETSTGLMLVEAGDVHLYPEG